MQVHNNTKTKHLQVAHKKRKIKTAVLFYFCWGEMQPVTAEPNSPTCYRYPILPIYCRYFYVGLVNRHKNN